MCSTSPVIAVLPYLPTFDGNAMPATSAQPETPCCDIDRFLAGAVSNSKIVTAQSCYTKFTIKDHKDPEKLETLQPASLSFNGDFGI
jgi:hypothetical protein